MSTIAVVGATGEVGIRLIHALRASYKIVAIVRNLKKRDFSLYPDVDVRQVDDISNVNCLAQSLHGCDAIVNAGYIWFAEDIYRAILQSRISIRHVVFTGSTGIYTSLPSQSADRKRAAETFIREQYSCCWTIIRPTMIYGHKDDHNISRLARAVDRYPILPLIGAGNGLIQPVLIHDLIRAYETALLDSRYYNKAYNIGGSKAYSNRELISCVALSLGRRTKLIPFPPALVHSGIALLSKLRISPISEEQVQRFQENKNIDIGPFITDFGYVPHDLEQGIPLLIRDLKDHGLLRRR